MVPESKFLPVKGKRSMFMLPLAVYFLFLFLVGAGIVPVYADSENLLMVSVAPTARQGGAKTVNAKILIKVPPAMVWEILTDYPALSDVLPGYEKSRVLSASGSSTLMDVGMRVSSFLPTYRYRVRAQENKAAHYLNLSRISGDFKSLNATYRLTPQNHGKETLLVYTLNIDPGFTMPGAIALIRSNTEKSMKALESHAEQVFRKSEIGQR